MSFLRKFVATMLVLAVIPCSASFAQFTVDIGDVTVAPGSSVSVPVSINSSAAGSSLFGVDIPLDIGNDGVGLPAGLTFNTASTTSAFSGLNQATSAGDVILQGFNLAAFGQPALSAPLNPAFTLDFSVASTVAPGTVFPIDVLAGQLNLLTATDGNSVVSTPDFSNGSITVAEAVPEPGSLAVLFACGGLVLTRRRRSTR